MDAVDQGPDLPLRERILLSVVLYAGVMSIYFAAGSIARPPLVAIETALDRAIPFIPAAMLGYGLCYVVPASLLWVETTRSGMHRLMRAAFLAYMMAAPFFLVMPVQDADPPLQPDGVLAHLLVLNRHADESKNAFPSMHVGLATLLAFVGARRSAPWGWALGGAAVVIAASTLLVKQHFIVDLVAGAAVGWLAYRIVYQGEDVE